MSAAAEPRPDARPGPEGPQGDALLGDHPEASQVDLRAGLLPQDAEDQEVELQRDQAGRRVRIAVKVKSGLADDFRTDPRLCCSCFVSPAAVRRLFLQTRCIYFL